MISSVQSTQGRKCKARTVASICPSIIPALIMDEGKDPNAIFSLDHPDHPHPLRPSHTLTCIPRLEDLVVQSPQARTLASTSPCHRSRIRGSGMVAAAGTKYGSRRNSPKDVHLAYGCVQTTRTASQKLAGDRVLGRMDFQCRGSCAGRTGSGCMARLGTLGDYS